MAAPAAGQELSLWLDASTSHARPPADVVADPSTYALFGTRLELDFGSATLSGAGRVGSALAGSDGQWLQGELGLSGSRRIGSLAAHARAAGFGLAYLEPYQYRAGGVTVTPTLARSIDGIVLSATPLLTLGAWRTDTLEGDLRVAGGDLEVSRTAGRITTALSAGALHVDNGVTSGAFTRAGARAVYAVGRWAGAVRLEAQRTPLESELGGGVTLAGTLAPGLELRVLAGRTLRDPLFGAEGTVAVSAGLSVRAVHSEPALPAPVAGVGERTDGGRRVRFTLRAPGAERVEITGDFTGWEPVPMEPGPDGWQVTRVLPPGVHHFGFLVDGEWAIPPDAPGLVDDGWGRRNASVVIEP